MRQKKREFFFPKIFILFGLGLLWIGATVTQFIAIPSSDKIYVRWISGEEDSVIRYELLRRNFESPVFQSVQTLLPKGSGQMYEVVDMEVAQLFLMVRNEPQSQLVQKRIIYLLRIVHRSGRVEEREVSVSFQTSSIRKTWGSIKALFR